jgi:hypothetical protein
MERLSLAGLGRQQLGTSAGVLDRLPGLDELDLLHALVGHHERDPPAVKPIRHECSPFVAVVGPWPAC